MLSLATVAPGCNCWSESRTFPRHHDGTGNREGLFIIHLDSHLMKCCVSHRPVRRRTCHYK